MSEPLRSPFPYFGGKSAVAARVWARLGHPKQYIEPFCGSAAMLLAAPKPASLEVIGDENMYIANFWRALKCQPESLWSWSDYPVSHVDLYARHMWLTEPDRRAVLVASLMDPEWPGDATMAGWWVWGQCCWIGSGWCDRERPRPDPARGQRGDGAPGASGLGKIPRTGNAGAGLQAAGLGKIPHTGNAGVGRLSLWQIGARDWLLRLSARLERVRVVHGDWDRCLNHRYGAEDTAVFLDPPYRAYERLYADSASHPVADAVAEWASANPEIRIALCGHIGDYALPGWTTLQWERPRNTYGGDGTKDDECVWFSPACLASEARGQLSLLGGNDG